MDSFQIFSVIGITATAALGLYNLSINIKSQRKYQRELIFQKQFEFFMSFQALISQFEDDVFDLNMEYAKTTDLQASILKKADEIDLLFSKNELIIPDSLFFKLSSFCSQNYLLSTQTFKDPKSIDNTKKRELMNRCADILDDMREYIGVDHLSAENRKLINSKSNRQVA